MLPVRLSATSVDQTLTKLGFLSIYLLNPPPPFFVFCFCFFAEVIQAKKRLRAFMFERMAVVHVMYCDTVQCCHVVQCHVQHRPYTVTLNTKCRLLRKVQRSLRAISVKHARERCAINISMKRCVNFKKFFLHLTEFCKETEQH